LSGLEETEVEASWRAPQEAHEHLLSETVSLVLSVGSFADLVFSLLLLLAGKERNEK